MKIECEIAMRTVSEANTCEHWTKAAKRHKLQQFLVRQSLMPFKGQIKPPCSIILTRLGGRHLDEHDNLRIALKWIVDQIADFILPGQKKGRADDSKLLHWAYKQEKRSTPGVRIEIEFEE